MNLLIMGAPGSGKGTQAEILAKTLKTPIPTISTGAILRNAIAEGSQLGKKAKAYMDEGNLVPDEIIIGIVMDRIKEKDCEKGYILDGFPRTLKQAQAMDTAGILIDNVIFLDVSDEQIEKRIVGRRVCANCGATYHITSNPPKVENVCDECDARLIFRDDDKPETVQHRLKTYHEQTEPVIEYYKKQGKVLVIKGIGSAEDINKKLLSALEV